MTQQKRIKTLSNGQVKSSNRNPHNSVKRWFERPGDMAQCPSHWRSFIRSLSSSLRLSSLLPFTWSFVCLVFFETDDDVI